MSLCRHETSVDESQASNHAQESTCPKGRTSASRARGLMLRDWLRKWKFACVWSFLWSSTYLPNPEPEWGILRGLIREVEENPHKPIILPCWHRHWLTGTKHTQQMRSMMARSSMQPPCYQERDIHGVSLKPDEPSASEHASACRRNAESKRALILQWHEEDLCLQAYRGQPAIMCLHLERCMDLSARIAPAYTLRKEMCSCHASKVKGTRFTGTSTKWWQLSCTGASSPHWAITSSGMPSGWRTTVTCPESTHANPRTKKT